MKRHHNMNIGSEICRGCKSNNLFVGINLGELPIANELYSNPMESFETFPLCLKICRDCGLGQVQDVVSPERIFRDYRYLSSTSTFFLNHARDFVDELLSNGTVGADDWVLEIACNDGYLLRNFLEKDISCLGIEPASNVALIAQELGIEVLNDFFTENLARKLVSERGHPKLVIANNVLAHVPDIQDFMKGLSVLAGEKTVVSIENPSILNILEEMQFDTIYHEHFSYLSALAVRKIALENNLVLFDLQEINAHGGSNRYWLARKESAAEIQEKVQHTVERELSAGILEREVWDKTNSKVQKILQDFTNWLNAQTEAGKKVVGYGAAAKASTLINASLEIGNGLLAIADASHEKQGRFMPKFNIPIISINELLKLKPNVVIVFPWNIKDEIVDSISPKLPESVEFWVAVPEMLRIETVNSRSNHADNTTPVGLKVTK